MSERWVVIGRDQDGTRLRVLAVERLIGEARTIARQAGGLVLRGESFEDEDEREEEGSA